MSILVDVSLTRYVSCIYFPLGHMNELNIQYWNCFAMAHLPRSVIAIRGFVRVTHCAHKTHIQTRR